MKKSNVKKVYTIIMAMEKINRQKYDFKDTVVEIHNFELRYDGIYHITWYEKEIEHRWFLYLNISQLLRMIELEGFSMSDIYKVEKDGKPLKFEKVVLTCTKTNSNFDAWGFTNKHSCRGSTLENDGVVVRLAIGGTIEQNKHDFLLMQVDVKDHKIKFKP